MLLVAVALPVQAQPAKSAAATPAATPTRTVLVMGDSLSAGYGMAASQGWVALTGDRLATRNPGWRVVNASISGETSAGGASRIQAELKRTRPSVVVIALGANDGLRGLPLEQTRGNLDRMIRAAKGARARVLLVGMRMPPNLGKAYTDGFSANYAALAKAHGVTLLPFLLEPIALDRNAYQADNLHPTAAAQPMLADPILKALDDLPAAP